MCGICGYTGPTVEGLLGRMAEAIRHRGPDSGGAYSSPEGDVHLGVRRLRILDVEGGDQPIFDEERKLVLIYNGEIYNFRELRAELETRGHRFSTRTDSEVIVHLYEEEGVETPRRLEGMFAFALYDGRRRRLLLARDPVGIKPLLYAWDGRRLVFASEAKSILLHPAVTPELDPAALHDLLNLRFVLGPRTLFRGVQQLPPGSTLVLEAGRSPTLAAYHQWTHEGPERWTPEEAAEAFRERLARAVSRQLVSDVPVGVFLSGGLDSSAVLAAATSASRGPLETFTLGFGEATDEVADAAVAARHFGSMHHETQLESHSLELLPRIVYHAEMPKVNAPQGFYLSRFARERVTVALSGLGGDELFFGYGLYRYLRPGRWLAEGPAAPFAQRFGPWLDLLAAGVGKIGLMAEMPRRALELAASSADPLRYYSTLRNGWDLGRGRSLYVDSWQRRVEATTRDSFAALFDRPERPLPEQVQWAELRGKLVDDFLLNEDRMSMASSLEVRVPMLDPELIRFALSLPLDINHAGGRLKPVPHRALEGVLPPRLLRKKKAGFAFDSYAVFRRELRELCARELTPAFLSAQGIVRPGFVREVLDHRPTRWLRWHYFVLWLLLGLKLWQEIFLERRSWQEIEDRLRRRAAS